MIYIAEHLVNVKKKANCTTIESVFQAQSKKKPAEASLILLGTLVKGL